MHKKTRKVTAWQWPPRSSRPVLRTQETFPGVSFLKKGVRWLDFSLASDYGAEERKQFARNCFRTAIKRCNQAALRAKRANNRSEVARLAEIATWVESQYLNTL
jgi:hypothetical protein